MPSLLDKLNTLVKASLNNVVSDSPALPGSLRSRVPAARLGKDIDREIAALRQHIDQALTQEDSMKDRLAQMRQQNATYDQQADVALQAGDEDEARRLIQQMKRQDQLANMLEAELGDHRQATSELIERVNTLDAMVADARRNSADAPADPGGSDAQPDSAVGAGSLSSMLREARERVEDTLAARSEPALHIPITVQDQQPATPTAPTPPTTPSTAQPIGIKVTVPTNGDQPVPPPMPAPDNPQPIGIKVKTTPSDANQPAPIPTLTPSAPQPIGIKITTTPPADKPADKPAAPPLPPSPSPASKDDTDDDIARRRARLSKPN